MEANENVNLRKFEKVLEILDKYHYDRAKLITILQKVQEEYRFLPEEILIYIATALKMPVAEIYGVATFYAHFTLTAKGQYVIKVCDGTACHVKGSGNLIGTIRKKLGLKEGIHTTADMMFTLETVSCLGACGLAPVMVINEQVYGQVNEVKISEIIDSIAEVEFSTIA
jgi:NADH:ubiquinone oxidoreductase subunit E